MLFPTVEFAIFFFIVFFISWQLNNRWRKLFLLAASFFFYGFWNWNFTCLLLACSTGNYLTGLLLGRAAGRSGRKIILSLAIVFNLGILFFFKYCNFFITSFNNLFLGIGLQGQLPMLNLILPVGISFFTFQGLSYVIDVYRRDLPVESSPLNVLLYISFFPQLVAGPILRAGHFLPQLKQRQSPADIDAGRNFLLIISGLFKKIIVAHYLAVLFVDPVFADPAACSRLTLMLGLYGYAVQIYCDFSAYSDIAVGIGGLLGFSFPANFNRPYRAAGLREFWQRWHISLSGWLRDYLYIPLGGSRKGRGITIRNLALTMLLGGLWHGAAWNFLLWGAWHGLGLILERILREKIRIKRFHIIVRILSTILTFHFVCLGWVFFRAGTLAQAFEYFKNIFTSTVAEPGLNPFIPVLICLGLIIQFLPVKTGPGISRLFNRMHPVWQGLICGAIILVAGSMALEGIAPFIYFQF